MLFAIIELQDGYTTTQNENNSRSVLKDYIGWMWYKNLYEDLAFNKTRQTFCYTMIQQDVSGQQPNLPTSSE